LLEPCAGITRQHGSEGAGPQQCGPATRLVSPLLANVYLHRLDRAWDTRAHGVLVRFADDVVVMCVSRAQAEAALVRLTDLLAELGLEPKAAKTRIVRAPRAQGERSRCR
jgi:retron-type reverse transcriptase